MTSHEELREQVARWTGIEIARGGVERNLEAFLTRRTRELGLRSIAEYLGTIEGPSSAEFEHMANAITVPHSWFMRDPGQLAAVERLLGDLPPQAPPCRIWVPGCATGEDVYSVAMIGERLGRAVEVLGTDLNSVALAQAELGYYGAWSIRDVERSSDYFTRRPDGQFAILPRLKRRVSFQRRNLLDGASGTGWDLILCRNVLIYFVREQARIALETLAAALVPDGTLLLGASEVVCDVPVGLEATYIAGRIAFRRTARAPRQAAAGRRRHPESLVPAASRDTALGMIPALPRTAESIVGGPVALRERPLSAVETRLFEGHARLDRSDLEGALAAYLGAAGLEPVRAEPHMYCGIVRYLLGDLDRATHDLRAALFLDDTLWPAAFYLATVHETLGFLDDALGEYRHVVRLAERGADTSPQMPTPYGPWHRDLLELARRRVGAVLSRHLPAP